MLLFLNRFLIPVLTPLIHRKTDTDKENKYLRWLVGMDWLATEYQKSRMAELGKGNTI